jgi:threonine dehydrogenase-like Zn-dependent dehydrogenase
VQRRMRAAFFDGPRSITVRETAVPEPAPGELRVRIRYCGICGSDVSLYKTGVFAGDDTILGHEISAVVEVDPSGRWSPGTRVTPFPRGRGCGKCIWCMEGKFRYCLDPPGPHGGGLAEYAVVPAESVIPVPDVLDDASAAVAEPLGVALRGVELAGARGGDLAYVSGLGSMGLLTVAGLVAAGCRVVGADPRDDRRVLGLEFGCETVLDNVQCDPSSALQEIDPHGPRVAMECSGAPASLQQVFDVCGPQGVVGILGIPMAPAFLLRMTLRDLRAFAIQGPSYESMARAVEFLRDRPRTAKPLITVVTLEEAGAAFEALAESRGGVKVLVAPGE